jgi:hypothetical protein
MACVWTLGRPHQELKRYKRINIPEFCFSFFIAFLSWNALIGFKLVNGGENLLRLFFPWVPMMNVRLKTFKSLERHCSKLFCPVTIRDRLPLQVICITSTALHRPGSGVYSNRILYRSSCLVLRVMVLDRGGKSRINILYWGLRAWLTRTLGSYIEILHEGIMSSLAFIVRDSRDGTGCIILRRLPVRDKHQYS